MDCKSDKPISAKLREEANATRTIGWRVALLMLINTWIKYTRPYLPTSRSRKYRYAVEEEIVPIELQEATPTDLIPAFVVEGEGRIYYLHSGNEQLYVRAEESDIWARRANITALSALIEVRRNYSTYFGFGEEDTREKMIAKADEDMKKYLLVDGDLYRITGEPRYHVATFGFGNNHGGTSLMVTTDYNSNCDPDSYFASLDGDLAVAAANEMAKRRGDTENIGQFRSQIVVLYHDAVKIPRRSVVKAAHVQDPATTKSASDVFVCPHCGFKVPQDQISRDTNDPSKWRFCPGCGYPMDWKNIKPITPGEIRCAVCGCWLGTVRADGSSYASSHYNGTDTCDDCQLEHCLATNCYGCKGGSYPDCQFIDMKKSYQEEND